MEGKIDRMSRMSKCPIIIINPDEMRCDSMGHMGNPAAKTPYLDSFAATEAVSFENAYCQNPVCVPSRCSFLTGLYPHVHGHRTMSYLLREGETSLFQELKNAGYYVWMNARNDLVAGQIPGLAASHADEIYYGDPVPTGSRLSMLGQMAGAMGGGRKEDPFPYSHFTGLSNGRMEADMRDTAAAVDRILHPVDDRPLCLFLGWVNPHPPYQVEEPYFSAIDRNLLPPRIKYEETKSKSEMIRRLYEDNGMNAYTEEQWAELRAVYLAQCCKVDHMFKMICDALKEAGIYDESAIFFLSDHGDFAGDYGMTEKAQNTFEDCLTKVPLLIKPPKGTPVDPGVTKNLAELVDFYATVMDYAGVQPDHDQFGHSLRPIIENRQQHVRNFACCEGGRMPWEEQCDEFHAKGGSVDGPYGARQRIQLEPLAHEKGTMIFDGRYKYVHRLSGACEFYDLEADPRELVNLFEERKYSSELLKLKAQLLDWYQTTCDVVPRSYDSRFTAERVWATVQGFCPPDREEEIKAYITQENPSIPEAIGYVMRIARQEKK